MVKLQVFRTGEKSASLNMAIDEILFGTGKAVLRFYGWKKPAVSIGRLQNLNQINTDFLRRQAMEIVRRPTGGGAVVHDREVTVSLSLPVFISPRSTTQAFRLFGRGVLAALEHLGVSGAMLHRDTIAGNGGYCFLSPGKHEVTVHGKKIAGIAMFRTRTGSLYQCSIPLFLDIALVARCFTFSPEHTESFTRAVRKNTTCLSQVLRTKTSAGKVEEILKRCFTKTLNCDSIEKEFSRARYKKAECLAGKKYRNCEWNSSHE